MTDEIYEEQRKLTLTRLRTLHPRTRIMFGESKPLSVDDPISHVESGDELGRNIVKAQINMLRVLMG